MSTLPFVIDANLTRFDNVITANSNKQIQALIDRIHDYASENPDMSLAEMQANREEMWLVIQASTLNANCCPYYISTRYSHYYECSPEVQCGKMFGGEVQLCADHEKMYAERYPQGWIGYPGDLCRHGKYVGGCGVDHICARCEYGEGEI